MKLFEEKTMFNQQWSCILENRNFTRVKWKIMKDKSFPLFIPFTINVILICVVIYFLCRHFQVMLKKKPRHCLSPTGDNGEVVNWTTIVESTRQASADSYLITPLGKPRPIRTSSDVVYGICRGLPSAHHASAVWRKAPLHRTIFRLNLEKNGCAHQHCLQVQRLTGVIFIIHCSYLVIPKLYFIEIEVNSIKGKICRVLKWRHL